MSRLNRSKQKSNSRLPQTYDVVRKALKLKPDDLDGLVLMTAVCTLLHKHKEAIANGLKATTNHPDSARAHGAFVKAMFSWADPQKPEQKYIDAHFHSLEFLERHDPTILRAVPFEPDGHTLLAMVKARSDEVHKTEENFKTQPLPMSLFAQHIGRSIFTVWATLLRHKEIKVRMAFGPLRKQTSGPWNSSGSLQSPLRHSHPSFSVLSITNSTIFRSSITIRKVWSTFWIARHEQ